MKERSSFEILCKITNQVNISLDINVLLRNKRLTQRVLKLLTWHSPLTLGDHK